jgi:phosphoglycerate dehydrogenase-like enzyme
MVTNAKPKVCILVPLEPELQSRIESACEVARPSGFSQEDLYAALADVEGVLLFNALPVDASFLDAAPRLRVVSGFGVGYDNVDLAEATKRGVVVCNTPQVLNAAVANLAFGMILALSRRLFQNEMHCRSGAWSRGERPPPLGFDLAGKTLGVVGFGRIGKEVTRRAHAFDMTTLFNDVFRKAPPGAPESRYRPLDDLLRESDIVTLHPDLNPTSYHLIGARELALMKSTACLVNTSRGPVVDQPALVAALREERIAGAAVDVLEQEPPDADEPVVDLPNVLTFPHIGTATNETRYAMRELTVRNLLAALAGETPPACVNPEVLGLASSR